jgi:hypothetical protein
MSEVVTAEQIEAFRTNGFVVVDDLLTDAELDTFEPLVTAAVAYRSAGDERTLEEPGADTASSLTTSSRSAPSQHETDTEPQPTATPTQ